MSKPLRRPRTIALACAGLALATLAVYANSFSGPFIFDDLLSIPQNPSVRHLLSSLTPPGGGLTVSGRPVLNASFALNYAASGEQVGSYHAVNLAIHLLAGLTLFGIVRHLVAASGKIGRASFAPLARVPDSAALSVAFVVALLWLVHPLQTESVTYLVQRAESLMGLFYLLTLYAFIRGAELGSDPRARRRRLRWWAASFACCLLGMATKEVMVSAPLIILLYDRTFVSGSFRAAWVRHGRMHLALAVTWLLLAALVLTGGNRGGTAGFGVGIAFGSYAATQFQAVCHYLWLTIWPHPLAIDYGTQWPHTFGAIAPYAAGVGLALGVTAAALIWRPAIGFMGAWFFAILAPTALVPGTRQTLAEHRMYLALAPVLVLLAVLTYRAGRRSFCWCAAAAAISLSWLTVERNTVYRSDLTVWRDTVLHRPGNAAAHNNYGNVLSHRGEFAAGLAQYDAAVGLDPGYGDAYFNAGNALVQLGRLPEAVGRYQQALALNPQAPETQAALGLALERAGRADEALAHLAAALRLNPGQPDLHNEMGRILRTAGRTPEAVGHFQQALQLRPDYAAAHNNLGNVFREADRQPAAIAEYEQALRTDPGSSEVRNNLGISLLLAGRTPDAIAQFEWALRLNPNLAQVHLNLALAYSSQGRAEQAAAQFDAAKQLGATLPESGR